MVVIAYQIQHIGRYIRELRNDSNLQMQLL